MQKSKIFIGIIILLMSSVALSQETWQSETFGQLPEDEKIQGAERQQYTPKTAEVAETNTPKETENTQIVASVLTKIKNGKKLEEIELQELVKQIEANSGSEENYDALSVYKINKENDQKSSPCELIPDLPVCGKSNK